MIKINRLIRLITYVTFIILLFIILINSPKNYQTKYKIDNYAITETYNKKDNIYTFSISFDDKEYSFNYIHKYIKKRHLITSVNYDNNCLTISSNYINTYTLCKNEYGEYITPFYDNNEFDTDFHTYENLKIYNLNNRKYYIWNYKEFLVLSNKEYTKLSLFDNDIYELNNIIKLNKYLFVMNYNDKYFYNGYYLINSKNDKYDYIKLGEKISENSYILGTEKKNIYLYDVDKEKEFKINPYKKTEEKHKYEILVNGSWEKTSKNKLNKKDLSFTYNNKFSFYVENDKLIYNANDQKILVTSMKIDRIIGSNEYEIFFISDDTLYYINITGGIKKLISYSEWAYNNKNIYVF